jgi:hypothetical protein
MLLLEEMLIEILMIAAVVVAVGALVHLLQLSVREQVYLRRLRRDREASESTLVTSPQPQKRRTVTARVRREAGTFMLHEKHV